MNTFYGGYDHTTTSDATHACNCIGPRGGQPLCPCQMKGVTIREGRYVKIIDLGPAPLSEAKEEEGAI